MFNLCFIHEVSCSSILPCLCVKVLTSRSNMLECIECRFFMCTLQSNWSSSTTHGTMPSLPAPAATHTHRHRAIPDGCSLALSDARTHKTSTQYSAVPIHLIWVSIRLYIHAIPAGYLHDYYTTRTEKNKHCCISMQQLVDPPSERARRRGRPAGLRKRWMNAWPLTGMRAGRRRSRPARWAVSVHACTHA